MIERIYLDHAATTAMRPEAVEAMLPFLSEIGYNPSSLHAEGRLARAALDDARDRVARALECSRRQIIFTGSGSESDNQAIFGAARVRRDCGKHIVSTAIEHHAVLHALDVLRDDGYEIDLLPVEADGTLDPERFRSALRPDTALASVMYANNELGAISPVFELAAIARAASVLFHTDAVQAAAWLPVGPGALGADLISLSAHKFYGPKGVGVLVVRDGVELPAMVHGGGQESGRRSGTENVAGIVGLSKALELAVAERVSNAARVGALRDRLEAGIDRIPETRINGRSAARLPNISNVSFADVDSEALLARLDLAGIAVSAGSACTAGALEPSHVVAALRAGERWQRGVIRFSLGRSTNEAQVDRVLQELFAIVRDLRP